MKRIELGNTEDVAIVDDADYSALVNHNWYLEHTGYVCTSAKTKSGKWGYVSMHRMLLGFPEGKQVHHKNGNKLDNQRENLEVTTLAEHTSHHHKGKKYTEALKAVRREQADGMKRDRVGRFR